MVMQGAGESRRDPRFTSNRRSIAGWVPSVGPSAGGNRRSTGEVYRHVAARHEHESAVEMGNFDEDMDGLSLSSSPGPKHAMKHP